ncbi:dynein light chain Tctex-type protein 2B-like [Rhopilema esculentum]|uniref:dynein light chain Tctex-type protein 2B-like n=1 Tax=Rhopilema esculentum TaxID=499914 RepID=UPI0031DD5076|eukprot:gene4741-21042_t
MLKAKAGKSASLPPAICKTDIISVGSNESEIVSDTRKRSHTWHGIEEITDNLSNNTPVLTLPHSASRRRSGRDHQDKWETRIKIIVEQELSERLKNVDYDHVDCKELCTNLNKSVHDKLKSVTDMAFKIIVLSFIGELQGDGIEAATQCTWEPQKDTMVTAYFKNETLFALTNIFMTRVPETTV